MTDRQIYIVAIKLSFSFFGNSAFLHLPCLSTHLPLYTTTFLLSDIQSFQFLNQPTSMKITSGLCQKVFFGEEIPLDLQPEFEVE